MLANRMQLYLSLARSLSLPLLCSACLGLSVPLYTLRPVVVRLLPLLLRLVHYFFDLNIIRIATTSKYTN